MEITIKFQKITIRKCSCYEEKKCRRKSLKATEHCTLSCGTELKEYDANIKEMVECFDDQKPFIKKEEKCFLEQIQHR